MQTDTVVTKTMFGNQREVVAQVQELQPMYHPYVLVPTTYDPQELA